MASYRQYALKITTNGQQGTSIYVEEWDIPASKYPERLASVVLHGVQFPSHVDAVDALSKALDVLRAEGVA